MDWVRSSGKEGGLAAEAKKTQSHEIASLAVRIQPSECMRSWQPSQAGVLHPFTPAKADVQSIALQSEDSLYRVLDKQPFFNYVTAELD